MPRLTKPAPHLARSMLVAVVLSGLSCGRAYGEIILTTETIVVTGTATQTVETKTATGQVTVTPPGGPAMTKTMPATGGTIEIVVPGLAAAKASVDVNTQRKWHAWAFRSDSGYTASASTDLHKMKTTTAVTFSQIITRVRVSLDPREIVDSYFAPGTNGNIDFDIQLTDDTAGTTLFDSSTALSSGSPDVVNDSTGELTWNRAPGLFDGAQGDLSGLPNQFSNNRWVLEPFSLAFDIPTTLDVGEDYLQNIALTVSSNGSVLSGTGVIGVSDVIPEPSTWLLIGVGFVGLIGWRRWAEARDYSS